MADWSVIKGTLRDLGCAYREEEPLSAHTSFHIGGPCPVLATPSQESQISALIKACGRERIPFVILGKGSNLLVSDDGYDGLVIKLDHHFSDVTVREDGVMLCQAGAPLAKVCYTAYSHGLTGLEVAWGIPGSVGGAAYMNAGAYDGEMKNVLTACRHLDAQGNPGGFSSGELDLSYRHSAYSGKDFCITQVELALKPGEKKQIRARMDELMARRHAKQPLEFPSAGSTFKRPQGNYASALIDQCGLRGLRVGGAMVSEKHCGFVINAGNATCRDVLELIGQIQTIVFEKTGYQLECEVKILS